MSQLPTSTFEDALNEVQTMERLLCMQKHCVIIECVVPDPSLSGVLRPSTYTKGLRSP